LAVVFRPTSTAVQINNIHHDENCENKDSKPAHQLNGLELFDAFKEANRSTMLTRLTESLDEIRLKGWVFPFTLLIKGPHEDVEVIKEAWRRHFLRSPDNFIIKDIGAVSSVGMEVIQQAPFLPLTKSLMETIAALNRSQLTATQQSIAEYLAKTYQYVHVPKLNVIHDCLGILIKERKIYHTGNGYFVSTHSPFDKPADAAKENGNAQGAKDSKCVACEVISKGKAAKAEKAKKKVKGKENENGKVKTPRKEAENGGRKTSVDNADSKRATEEKEEKSSKPRKEEATNKSPSETASESGASEVAAKKAKKQKKGVLDHISCFIKGRSFPTSDVEETKQEQTAKVPSPPPQRIPTQPTQRTAPLAFQEDMSPSLPRNVQFRTQRTLSAPAGHPSMHENIYRKELEEFSKIEIKNVAPNPRQLNPRQLARSKSFVAAERRPAPPMPVMRSNSFSAPSTRAARQIPTDIAPPGTWDRRMRMNYGDIIRNTPARQTIHVSRPSSCNIGVVRPLSMTQQRPLSRSNSMKKEKPEKKGGSLSPASTPRDNLTPSSTPRLKEKTQGRPDLTVVRSRSFTEPGMLRMANRQVPGHRATIAGPYFESPLQQLLARNPNGYISTPRSGVRVTVPPKGRHYTPGKHPTTSSKKTPPNSPLRKGPTISPQLPKQKQKPDALENRKDCTSPVYYDTTVTNDRVENCKCNGISNANGTHFAPVFNPKNYKHVSFPSDGISSEHVFIEEMTTSASEMTLVDDRYGETGVDNESKSLGVYKKVTEEGVNDSLTFIGII